MPNKKKGFTVVELVIVIAVIGILSAILIPTFVNLTKRANEAKLREELTYAYTAYMEANIDAVDYVDKENAVLVKVQLENEATSATVYKFIQTSGYWEERTLNGTFEQVGEKEADVYVQYNGYYVYRYTPAA